MSIFPNMDEMKTVFSGLKNQEVKSLLSRLQNHFKSHALLQK